MVLVNHLKKEFHLYVFPGASVFAWKVAGGYCFCAAAVLPKPTGAGILTIKQICLVLGISQAEQFNHFEINWSLPLINTEPAIPTYWIFRNIQDFRACSCTDQTWFCCCCCCSSCVKWPFNMMKSSPVNPSAQTLISDLRLRTKTCFSHWNSLTRKVI